MECEVCEAILNSKNFIKTLRYCSSRCFYHRELEKLLKKKINDLKRRKWAKFQFFSVTCCLVKAGAHLLWSDSCLQNIGTQGVQELFIGEFLGGSNTQWTRNSYDKVNSLFSYDVHSQKRKKICFAVGEAYKTLCSCNQWSSIVRVRVVQNRTIVGDWRLDHLSESNFQSQVNSICQSIVLEIWSVESELSV